MKLFCFPYAGGSAMVYNKWKKMTDANLEIVPVELPGRGMRIREALCDDMDSLVEDIIRKIESSISQDDFMFFGHSMGSWIVYFLMNRLIRDGRRLPVHVYFSGKEAPHLAKKETTVHDLPHSDFINKIASLGGTPPGLLDDSEVQNVFLPILRNDYKLIETCKFANPMRAYPSHITVFNGAEDSFSLEELHGWSSYTEKSFSLHHFEGGHFFIHEHAPRLLGLIQRDLAKSQAG